MKNICLFLSMLLLGLVACNQENDSSELIPDLIEATKSEAAFEKIMQTRGTDQGSDAFKILSATVSDDLLELTVQYSGECEKHVFEAYWNGGFYPTAVPPSLAPVVINHQANGDLCEAAITETLKIDVKKLFGADYSTKNFIPIVLNGSSQEHVIAEPAGKCDFTGTVIIENDFDACAMYINLDNGTTIEPVDMGGNSFEFKPLQRVSLSYTAVDQASICMVGQAVKIECIEEIGSGARISGTVKDFSHLDGCGFIIELGDGTRLEPAEVMVKDFTFRDNQKVLLSYVPLDQASICMTGITVRITGIEEM